MNIPDLQGQTLLVAGGTGNVGYFITRALLESGASVVVPSRSAAKLLALRTLLESTLDAAALRRAHFIEGDIADGKNGKRLLETIESAVGALDGALATLGRFRAAPSLINTDAATLQHVLDDYLLAHFNVARLLLPAFSNRGGRYVFVNGPLALAPWDGTGLVSVATAAQHMLFKTLAKELAGSGATLFEMMNYIFIRNHETQPGNPLRGEDVGNFAAWLFSGKMDAHNGTTLHVNDAESLALAG